MSEKKIHLSLEATISGGRLKLADKAAFDAAVAEFEGKHVEVVIEEYSAEKIKSRLLENYYWAVVLRYISDYTGYDRDELHEYYKLKFNAKRIHSLDGENEITVGGSTSTSARFNVRKQVEFVDKVRRHGEQLIGDTIPLPNQKEIRGELSGIKRSKD